MDEAINVYVVGSVDVGSGVAPLPHAEKNNMMVFNHGTGEYIIAHELGHNLGLLHTHQGNNPIPNTGFCNLLDPNSDPITTGDLIVDTPVDPSFLLCGLSTECPIATTPCTPTCTTGSGATYSYSNYWTNNIMGYYRSCLPQVLTDDQKDRVITNLMNHPGLEYLRNSVEPSCNNDISEIGVVNKYCQFSAPSPEIIPIKDIRIKQTNLTTMWETTRNTDTNGEYEIFGSNFSNLVQVKLNPRPSHPLIGMILQDPTSVPQNYHPKNGCNDFDIIRVGKHVLSQGALTPPYAYIAADVNLNGTITMYDVNLMRRVILNVTPDFPAGTWHYVPEYYFLDPLFEDAFETFPFTANYNGLSYPLYLDEVILDMNNNLAADANSWSFRSIKMGDVDCNMLVDEFSSNNPEGGLVNVEFASGICTQNNDIITITVMGSPNEPIAGYQMGISFDTNKIQYLGSSAGNLTDYNPENIHESQGEIRALWHRNDFQAESFTTPKILFKQHFKVLAPFCDLTNAFELNDDVLPLHFINNNLSSIAGGVVVNYTVESPKGKLLSVYPNPAESNATFAFEVNQNSLVEIRLSDYLGGQMNMGQSYSTGNHAYTFNNLTSLANGPINYSVNIGGVTYSGILIKSLP
ncbi:MAG: hypothetical protein SFV22_00090 [Saprospiraceae bacterium]|nr:hypothetical protein [Saprospiraceae bacterium]